MKWILVSVCAAITVVTVAGLSGGPIVPDVIIDDHDLDRETPGWIQVIEFNLTKGDSCPIHGHALQLMALPCVNHYHTNLAVLH